jgi:invasion protein IalB
MFDLIRPLALALAVALGALPAVAQETAPAQPPAEAPATTTEAPAAETPATPAPDLSMGQDTAGVTEPYVKATHGDWQLRCVKAEDGSDPCEIYQLLKDDKGNAVAEVTMLSLPEGGEAVAGATVVVPLETLLTQQVTIAIDGTSPKRYPFTFCASVGCFARIGFTSAEVEALKKGSKAVISVVPVAAPDKVVSVNISLTGFTDAFDAVKAERAAN